MHGGERPGVINFSTGLANALIDGCPVVALGGSSPISQFGRQVFQEIDQVAHRAGCVKYADRVHNLKRMPEQVNFAFQKALNGKPGPVYLDFPGDVLYTKIDEEEVDWSMAAGRSSTRAPRRAQAAQRAGRRDGEGASKPIIVSGSGVLWSHAWDEMQAFVEKAGIPFYTTPQGRGVVPDDHPISYLTMRNDAFREADLIIILGTRTNYVIGHAAPPRFSADAKIARIDIDPEEMGTSARNIDIRIVGDCKAVLQQLFEAVEGQDHARPLPGLAPEAGRRRGQAHARRRQLPDRRRHPSAAAVRGDQELHAARRDPLGRRAGDPQFRPPVDPDLRRPAIGSIPGPSARWAWACRSRSAPRPPSPTSRSSACTATARSG